MSKGVVTAMIAKWKRLLVWTSAMVLGVALLPGCADESPEPSRQLGLSAQELAAMLVEPPDLGAGWRIQEDPSATSDADPGVVTEEMREMLPRIEFCAEAGADARAAAEGLEWQAFRQLDLDTGEPSAPEPGERLTAHLVFVQEFLLSGDAADLIETYDALSAGMQACVGRRTEYPDGEVGEGRPFEAPAIGDARTGTREVVTEPGGKGAPVWDLRMVIARQGDVLLGITVAEITTPGVDPVIDDAALAAILTTIATKVG